MFITSLQTISFYTVCSYRVVDLVGYSSAFYCTLNTLYRIVSYRKALFIVACLYYDVYNVVIMFVTCLFVTGKRLSYHHETFSVDEQVL